MGFEPRSQSTELCRYSEINTWMTYQRLHPIRNYDLEYTLLYYILLICILRLIENIIARHQIFI